MEFGWHRAAEGGRWGRARGAGGGSCTVPWQREPPPCTHRSLRQLRDSCGLPFTAQNALHRQIQFLGCPQCHFTEPPWFGGGRVTLSRGEMLPPVTEAEIQPQAGAAPEPTPLFPGAALSRAGRRGRKQLAAACRAQEGPARLSLLFPRPGGNHRGGCRAGLGSPTAEGRCGPQHPPVTGLCPAPATPHGCLEGSDLASGSRASNLVPKPTARPGPRAARAAQPGREHRCTPNRSLHAGRDKGGHGDGELTPLTSRTASPALCPAPSSPGMGWAPTQGKPTLAP